jgi:hypothetical protein
LPAVENQQSTLNSVNLAYYWGIHQPQTTSETSAFQVPINQPTNQFTGLFQQFSTGQDLSATSQATTDQQQLVSWPFMPQANNYQSETSVWNSIQIPQVSYNMPKVTNNLLSNQY